MFLAVFWGMFLGTVMGIGAAVAATVWFVSRRGRERVQIQIRLREPAGHKKPGSRKPRKATTSPEPPRLDDNLPFVTDDNPDEPDEGESRRGRRKTVETRGYF
jgi:hypothetical protein